MLVMTFGEKIYIHRGLKPTTTFSTVQCFDLLSSDGPKSTDCLRTCEYQLSGKRFRYDTYHDVDTSLNFVLFFHNIGLYIHILTTYHKHCYLECFALFNFDKEHGTHTHTHETSYTDPDASSAISC